MEPLTGTQRKYLRGLGHGLKPVVLIGQKGLTDATVRSIAAALRTHELIKVKFNEFKEKGPKQRICDDIQQRNDCQQAGMIGHIALFYRPHDEPDKRRIQLPPASPAPDSLKPPGAPP